MAGVTEYAEGYDVWLAETTGSTGTRLAIRAWNEAGHNATEVDLLQLLAWVKANRPDLMAIVRPAFLPVMEMAEQYRNQWRGRAEHYWLARLMEEVGELAASTVGDHEDPPEHELRQIASICLNWLDRFYA